MVALHSV
jgi:hypothetical protein